MSINIMAGVWKLELPQGEKLLLLALADHADYDGNHIFPSVARQSWKTGISERQVQRLLRKLEARQILISVAHRKGGRGWATEYRIDLSAGNQRSFEKKGDIRERVTSKTEKGDIGDIKGGTNVTPSTIESPYESSSSASAKRPRADSGNNAVRKALEKHFISKTKLPPPPTETAWEKKAAGTRWWRPLRRIAELTEWDVVRGQSLINAALKRMDGLTISAPQSILKTTIAIIGEQARGVARSRDGPGVAVGPGSRAHGGRV